MVSIEGAKSTRTISSLGGLQVRNHSSRFLLHETAKKKEETSGQYVATEDGPETGSSIQSGRKRYNSGRKFRANSPFRCRQ